MSSITEDHSLLEVREWKEQCRQEDQELTPKEYLEKLRHISEQMKARYHIQLQKIHPSPSKT